MGMDSYFLKSKDSNLSPEGARKLCASKFGLADSGPAIVHYWRGNRELFKIMNQAVYLESNGAGLALTPVSPALLDFFNRVFEGVRTWEGETMRRAIRKARTAIKHGFHVYYFACW